MTDQVRLYVDAGVCVGIGQCEALEPDVFEYDEDGGFATARTGVTVARERADAVMRSCPSGAISILDGDVAGPAGDDGPTGSSD